MKKLFSKVIKMVAMLMAVITTMCIVPVQKDAYASTLEGHVTPIKAFPISNANNTYVYASVGGTKIGTIYAEDLCTILGFYSNGMWIKVSYPLSNGKGNKTGYVKTSAFFDSTSTSWNQIKLKSNATVYRRYTGSSTIGTAYSTDTVYMVSQKQGMTQIIYSLNGGGYKCGWVKDSCIQGYITAGNYIITTALNNARVLDVQGNNTANGANVQIYQSSDNNTAQIFYIESIGNGYFKISNSKSGKALDVAGGVRKSGVNVQMYEYNGTDAQQWKFISAGNGYYYIQNKLGYMLDVSGGSSANGTNVQVYTANSTNSQKWKLTPVTTCTNWDGLIGTTVADINSKYYTTDNISYVGGYKGQCTWYAYGRFYEVTGIKLPSARHAKYWLSDNYSNSKVTVTYGSSNIKAKSIAVRTSGNYGHVIFIEEVTYKNGLPEYVYFTECNTDGNGTYNVRKDCIVQKMTYSNFINSKNIAGYISAK